MNKKTLILALSVILCQLVVVPAYAVRAYPFPVVITQPDGTKLTVCLKGDEFHHARTSEDGFLLKKNSKGFFTYATLNSAGEVVGSDFIARNVAKRSVDETRFLKTINQSAVIQKAQSTSLKSKAMVSPSRPQKAYPLLGAPKSLVILVNFSDQNFVTPTPNDAFKTLLNEPGYSANGGTGSARDYFMASSYGKFTPDFDVVGPVTLPQTLDYYGANDASGNDTIPVQMIVDACTVADATIPDLDFSQYDTDDDGYIDNVFVYYAGYNEAEQGPENTVWPHRWSIYPDYNYSGTYASITFDGKILRDYACTSELRGNLGSNMCGIGTFCHEFSHVLGLPDYYNTDTQASTLGFWSIMDSGNYSNAGRTPPTYSVYDRFYLGWLTPEQISTPSSQTLLPIYQGTTEPVNTTNQAFLLSASTHNLNGKSPDPNEFFMLEYRVKTGWDTYLPAQGMCIWHIDYDPTAWSNNNPNYFAGSTQTNASHMHVYLVPSTAVATTPPTAVFTTGSFTPVTWAGVDINRVISNMTKTTENITFNFMPPRISDAGGFADYSTDFGTLSISQSLDLSALNLNSNLNLSFQNGVDFEMKLSTDNVWSKTLALVPVSGTVAATLDVRYNPTSTGTQTDVLNLTSVGATDAYFGLTGTSAIGPGSPLISVGTVDNNLLFYQNKLFTTSTKTINIKTTDVVSDLNLAISGTNASLFTVSTNAVTKDAANAQVGVNITIDYTPTTLGNHSATLTISGGGLPDKAILLSGTGY